MRLVGGARGDAAAEDVADGAAELVTEVLRDEVGEGLALLLVKAATGGAARRVECNESADVAASDVAIEGDVSDWLPRLDVEVPAKDVVMVVADDSEDGPAAAAADLTSSSVCAVA